MKYLWLSACLIFTTGLFGQCFMERHSTLLSDAWASCSLEENPNATRGNSHWIMYDFREIHQLGTSHFWNINTPGLSNMGAQNIAIDYSLDGQNWIHWGDFSLSRAPESAFYEGEQGPDLSGIEARFILLTVLDNYGYNCSGLAEVRFETLGILSSTEDTEMLVSNLQVAPNPARDISTINFTAAQSQDASIRIYDATGLEVLFLSRNLNPGENRINLDLSNLSSGNYLVSLDTGRQVYQETISVIK